MLGIGIQVTPAPVDGAGLVDDERDQLRLRMEHQRWNLM